jgi:hypothetical protein
VSLNQKQNMQSNITKFIVSLTIVCSSLPARCQEQEYRIKSDEIPTLALEYVTSFSFTKKIKWYLEKNNNNQSIEAKTKWQKHKYSIEFDTLGTLQDVEITVNEEEIVPATLQGIQSYMTDSFTSHQICKIQRQYSGEPAAVRDLILNNTPSKKTTICYEIVAEINDQGVKKRVEFLFDDKGKPIRTTRLYYRNTDNLEY